MHEGSPYLKPCHIIDLYQPQALTSGVKTEVEAMLWEVDDDVLVEKCLHTIRCASQAPHEEVLMMQHEARSTADTDLIGILDLHAAQVAPSLPDEVHSVKEGHACSVCTKLERSPERIPS